VTTIPVSDHLRYPVRPVKSSRSILIVEQDITSTLRIADYAYVMENGRITVEGTPAQLRDNSEVLASYLGGQLT